MRAARQTALVLPIVSLLGLSACGWVDGGVDKNEPPVPADDSYTVAEGGTLDVAASSGVLANDNDAGGAALTARLVAGPASTSSFELNSDGSFLYVHDGNETISDNFTYVANDGIEDSSVKVVAITVNPINDRPVILGQVESPVIAPKNAAFNVIPHLQVNDPDNTYPGDFTVTVQPGPNYTAAGGIVTAAPDYTGSLTIPLTVNDGNASSDLFTLMMMVTFINSTPVFVSTPVTTASVGDGYRYKVVATDPDVDDKLTITAPTLPSWLKFKSDNKGKATLEGKPKLFDFGNHPVVLLVSDNGTPTKSATQSFVISVSVLTGSDNDANDNAIAQQVAHSAACWTTAQEQSIDATLPREPTLIAPLSYSLVTGPTKGELTLNTTGQFIYTPALDSPRGRDTFKYVVKAATGNSVTRVANVIVNAKLMPLGDSVTAGITDATDPLNPLPTPNVRVGFRQHLFNALIGAGYKIDFVGSQAIGVAEDEPPFDTDNEAHEGWSANELALGSTTQDPRYPYSGIYHWLTKNPADVVLLHVGTDVPATNTDAVDAILEAISRWESDTGNIVTVILARVIDHNSPNPDVSVFNDQLSTLAMARITNGDHIVLVDQQRALWDMDGLPDPAYYGDAQHPNANGYSKMADVWFEALDEVLDKCP